MKQFARTLCAYWTILRGRPLFDRGCWHNQNHDHTFYRSDASAVLAKRCNLKFPKPLTEWILNTLKDFKNNSLHKLKKTSYDHMCDIECQSWRKNFIFSKNFKNHSITLMKLCFKIIRIVFFEIVNFWKNWIFLSILTLCIYKTKPVHIYGMKSFWICLKNCSLKSFRILSIHHVYLSLNLKLRSFVVIDFHDILVLLKYS